MTDVADTAATATAAARAVDARKTYGEGEAAVHALAGVTVELPVGRFTAIMGPSGSGKSTLMQCVAGLDRLTSGSAFIGDTDISSLSKLGGLVDGRTLDALGGGTQPTFGFIDLASGTQTKAKKAIEARADRRPDITVTEGNTLGRTVAQVFDFVIKAVNGLLLMSVVVALIGIINTLSLSILERRRELGLLRVVGMTDARVQRMIRLESLVIAGLGTIMGLALGLFGAWATVFSIDRLSAADIGLRFPVVQLLVVLVVGLGLGLLASVIPARRSTRVEVLAAINA